MTVRTLKLARELYEEERKGGGNPAVFVYQRTSGETLFAFFTDMRYFDLTAAPEVAYWCELMTPIHGVGA